MLSQHNADVEGLFLQLEEMCIFLNEQALISVEVCVHSGDSWVSVLSPRSCQEHLDTRISADAYSSTCAIKSVAF